MGQCYGTDDRCLNPAATGEGIRPEIRKHTRGSAHVTQDCQWITTPKYFAKAAKKISPSCKKGISVADDCTLKTTPGSNQGSEKGATRGKVAMASRTGLRWFRLSPEDHAARPPASQAKRRSPVEAQVKRLRFGASNVSDYVSFLYKYAYSSGNRGIVRVLYRLQVLGRSPRVPREAQNRL